MCNFIAIVHGNGRKDGYQLTVIYYGDGIPWYKRTDTWLSFKRKISPIEYKNAVLGYELEIGDLDGLDDTIGCCRFKLGSSYGTYNFGTGNSDALIRDYKQCNDTSIYVNHERLCNILVSLLHDCSDKNMENIITKIVHNIKDRIGYIIINDLIDDVCIHELCSLLSCYCTRYSSYSVSYLSIALIKYMDHGEDGYDKSGSMIDGYISIV